MSLRRVLALASGNRHKLQEFGEILEPLGWDVVSVREWIPDLPEPEETEPDFPGNARLKLHHALGLLAARGGGRLPDAVAADDSGLSVDLLGGDPGVFSARFAERAGRGSGDAANRAELVRRLTESGMHRGDVAAAAFHCAIAVRAPGSTGGLDALGTCPGAVGLEERGDGGFGYDPLFFPTLEDGTLSDRTFAELPATSKHGLSHRGRALRALAAMMAADRAGPANAPRA